MSSEVGWRHDSTLAFFISCGITDRDVSRDISIAPIAGRSCDVPESSIDHSRKHSHCLRLRLVFNHQRTGVVVGKDLGAWRSDYHVTITWKCYLATYKP